MHRMHPSNLSNFRAISCMGSRTYVHPVFVHFCDRCPESSLSLKRVRNGSRCYTTQSLALPLTQPPAGLRQTLKKLVAVAPVVRGIGAMNHSPCSEISMQQLTAVENCAFVNSQNVTTAVMDVSTCTLGCQKCTVVGARDVACQFGFTG